MAKSIMIQGTMSNAGKSLLAAALCRIFRQDGWKCAPFKSQNMALNSYITADGLEMGRAQVMQAEAARTEPSVWMNPILLKPTSEMGSQVIVNGKVRGDMKAMDYYRNKKQLIPDIMKAYRELESQYDIIVLEGAGSPVELNLKQDDIVNMGMAKLVNAPVLLAGDIDRGGIFAQLLGTLMLLEPDERQRVKGLIVNKFRGDRAIFADGVRILEERGQKPVLGVVPWLSCDLEDEDSVSGKLEQETAAGLIDIAVIRLPRISNFTDFDVFRQFEGVSVRYVSRPQQLREPDLLFVPGTKNTMGDLKWMRESGMEAAVRRYASCGGTVFGICGGYQMLGMRLEDPECAERAPGDPEQMEGMGLLDICTVFAGQKRRTRVRGRFGSTAGSLSCLSGMPAEGYEIHMGRTEAGEKPLLLLQTGVQESVDGATNGANVYGCYLHGVFDCGETAECLIKTLYERKGLTYGAGGLTDRKAYKEKQYDLLADGVRKSLDMDMVYRILEHA